MRTEMPPETRTGVCTGVGTGACVEDDNGMRTRAGTGADAGARDETDTGIRTGAGVGAGDGAGTIVESAAGLMNDD